LIGKSSSEEFFIGDLVSYDLYKFSLFKFQ